MTDSDEPRPEVQDFLRDHAGSLDRDAAPVGAHEAAERQLSRSLEPARRWVHTPVVVAGHARRRPAIAAAVIAALLLGSLGGFAAGRSSASGGSSLAARGAAQDTTTPTVIESATASGFAVGGGGMYPGPPQMTRLFIRTTSDGVALRGYLQTNDAEMYGKVVCDPNSWCPPPECNPSTYFMGEASNAEAVTQGGSPQFPMDDKPAAARGPLPLGQMEGAPACVYMVQTTDDVTNVRATWSDGFVDEMAPVNGWAIVAHNGEAPPKALEATSTDGSTVAIGGFDYNGGYGGYAYPAQCSPPPPPPPELPPAGEEQPTDADAARQAITEAYQYVFTHGNDPDNNGNYIENAEALKDPAATVKQNFPEANDTVTVEVGEIRFLSATEAALFFELKYSGGALFGQQIGYAKVVDGSWKIDYSTMCMVLGWGGGQCDPPPDPAKSTSAGSAPQPGTYYGPEGDTSSASLSSASGEPAPTTAPANS
jgi:hypothetical protein